MPPKQGAAGKLPSESKAAGGRLVAIGSSPPREYSLDKSPIAIGTHPSNDVVLDDTTVSRRHATITRKAGIYELADLGSTNGTFVNGRRLVNPIALKPGDEIKFGAVRVAFDPQSVPKRLRRGFVILTVMFIAGFAIARYRSVMMRTATRNPPRELRRSRPVPRPRPPILSPHRLNRELPKAQRQRHRRIPRPPGRHG